MHDKSDSEIKKMIVGAIIGGIAWGIKSLVEGKPASNVTKDIFWGAAGGTAAGAGKAAVDQLRKNIDPESPKI